MAMTVSNRSRIIALTAAVIAAGMLSGCRSTDPAVKRSQQAADVLVDTSASLASGEQTVMQSQEALRTLGQAKGDLRPAFDLFVTQLENVRKQAARLRDESEVVKSQAAMYCSARQTDVKTISNDEMRQVAERRAAHVREECDNIKERYAQVNASFDRYIRNLSDLQTYLANELNYGALDSGQKWVDEALKSGEALRGNIRALSFQVELTGNMLSPVPLAATRWPNPIIPTEALAERPQ
ncbi:MAG: hypothetical protein JWM57_2675 [Phycisphaerales bacterium]|nr:hypothetical protein [Phycisphaerales bacterium]